MDASARYKNLQYSGAVKPINYSAAIPNGWGDVENLSTGEKNNVKFHLGQPTEIRHESKNKDESYSGYINPNFQWLDGKYETSQIEYRGTFRGNGVWDQGRVI